MKTLRTAVASITLILMTGGYAASQVAYLQGFDQASAYSARVDSPAVAYVALILLLLIVVSGFIPDGEAADPAHAELGAGTEPIEGERGRE